MLDEKVKYGPKRKKTNRKITVVQDQWMSTNRKAARLALTVSNNSDSQRTEEQKRVAEFHNTYLGEALHRITNREKGNQDIKHHSQTDDYQKRK